MNGPTANLSWDELSCWDRRTQPWSLVAPYPLEWRDSRAVELGQAFEYIREACGHKPIVIGSAYRTPAYNALVGGVPNSQHVQGRALDSYPPEGLTVAAYFEIVRRIAPATMIRFVKLYPAWGVHFDCRPSGVFRIDTSLRPGPEVPETGMDEV